MRLFGRRSLSRILRGGLLVFSCAVVARLVLVVVLFLGVYLMGWPPRFAHLVSYPVLPSLGYISEAPPGVWVSSPLYLLLSGARLLPISLGLLYIFSVLRQISATLVAEQPFLRENAARVRRIGIALLVTTLLQWAVGGLAYSAILTGVTGFGPTISNIPIVPLPDLTIALFGLLTLALAEVFRRGAELQDDHDLTV